MLRIVSFCSNPFQENSYLAIEPGGKAIYWDPGEYSPGERERLKNYIEKKGITLQHLINTHCHIDHVLGNAFVAKTYDLPIGCHKEELPLLDGVVDYGRGMGLNVDESPTPSIFYEEGDVVELGDFRFEVLFCPGHSPGSLCFLERGEKLLIGGDVLFQGSIGRTDLPGGDYSTLMHSICDKLMALEDDVVVYPGHGPSTTIGEERRSNPFINEWRNSKATSD